MTVTYSFDVFSRLDGFGGVSDAGWGGYWGKQGPEDEATPSRGGPGAPGARRA